MSELLSSTTKPRRFVKNSRNEFVWQTSRTIVITRDLVLDDR
jgi:hypothetical protein